MNLALDEMYVQGISTRKMIMVLQKRVGPEISISSTQVSRCNAALDEGLAAWRNRLLGATEVAVPPHQSRFEWQKIPFCFCRRKYVVRIDAQAIEHISKLVHQCDIHISLRIFDHL